MKDIEILAVEQNRLSGTLGDIQFSSLKRLKCLNLAGALQYQRWYTLVKFYTLLVH